MEKLDGCLQSYFDMKFFSKCGWYLSVMLYLLVFQGHIKLGYCDPYFSHARHIKLGFDMQTVGKDLAYTLRNETKFCNFRRNKAIAGLTFTLLGDALSAGVKVEDKFIANKQFELVIAGVAMAGHDDVCLWWQFGGPVVG
jgi:hypothetical protein